MIGFWAFLKIKIFYYINVSLIIINNKEKNFSQHAQNKFTFELKNFFLCR